MKTVKANESLFEAFGYSADEAANLEIRANLMLALERYIKNSEMTQREAAEFFGTHQPRINDLMKRRIDKFTIDALINLLAIAGRSVKVEILEPA